MTLVTFSEVFIAYFASLGLLLTVKSGQDSEPGRIISEIRTKKDSDIGLIRSGGKAA